MTSPVELWRAGRVELNDQQLRKGRALAILVGAIALVATSAAIAQEAQDTPQAAQPKKETLRKPAAPAGMVPYAHPIVVNGRTILWHGAWRGRIRARNQAEVARAPAVPAKEQPPQPKAQATVAPAPAATRSAGFTLLADPSDACASRLAGDFVAALKSGGAAGQVVVGGVSPAALAGAVDGDRADLAIAPMDALIGDPQASAAWRERAPFIAKLNDEPIEIVAARDISELRQLAGREVGFGPTDSAAATSAATLFRTLGIQPRPAYETLGDALNDLAAGRLAAVVAIDGRCAPALAHFGADQRFHELSIPWTSALKATYEPIRLTARERPNLIGANDKVETVAAPRALIALDAAPGSPRAQNAATLAKAFFSGFDRLTTPDKDGAWRDVNLAADAPWPRLRAAQEWIDAARPPSDASLDAFRGLARSAASANDGPAAADSDRLYDSLMQWRGAGK